MECVKKRFKKNNGFTLVEIIVVLVILAIPTMLGFVADAKAKAYIAEAREVYVAAQATATEVIGTGQGMNKTGSGNNPYDDLNSYWVSRSSDVGGQNFNNPASVQMKKYLSSDLKITREAYRGTYATGDSYWYVIMDYTVAAGTSGKVKEVYYVKNDYIVWFKEGSVTTEKLKPAGQRPAVPWSAVPTA